MPIKRKATPSDTADAFIKSISSHSKNEATLALVRFLNNLHMISKSAASEGDLFESYKTVAEQVLKLHRFPDVKTAIECFLDSNKDVKL